jgi:hypothetical protein
MELAETVSLIFPVEMELSQPCYYCIHYRINLLNNSINISIIECILSNNSVNVSIIDETCPKIQVMFPS